MTPLPIFSLQTWTSVWERSTAHPMASASIARGPSSVSVHQALPVRREAPAAWVRNQLSLSTSQRRGVLELTSRNKILLAPPKDGKMGG